MSSRADMAGLLRSRAVRGGSRGAVAPAGARVPLMKGFLRRLGYVAVASPGVELAVEREVRQHLQRKRTALGRGAIGTRSAQQLAGNLHRGLLHGGELA